MKLSRSLLDCLKEINSYEGYPSYWKPKTREKLVSMGLVEQSDKKTRFYPSPVYQLTELGREIIKENTAA